MERKIFERIVALSMLFDVFFLVTGFIFGTRYAKPPETKEVTKEVIKYVEVISTDDEPTTQNEGKWQVKSLGMFTLTAYDPCAECSEQYGDLTATGTTAKEGRTIAVDPSVIPYGSKVIINGEVYTAEDCGAYIKGNKINIFFDTHKEVDDFGKQAEVFLLEEQKN